MPDTAGQAESRTGAWASVRACGALGDGVHDDSEAVTLAIRATLGKTLFFPNGTYRITKDAPFAFGDAFSGTHWIFDNQAQILYTGAATMLTLVASTRGAINNFVLDGLNVRSMGGGVVAAQGIYLVHVSACRPVDTGRDDSLPHRQSQHRHRRNPCPPARFPHISDANS
jgi:hypothetical protein